MTSSALILAGGASKRFGRPKALIEMSGRPLIDRVADALAPLVDETIVSVSNPDVERRIRSLLPHAAFVMDERSGRGPIEGFRQGFRAARGRVVLVAPCDAPLLQTSLYHLLLDVLGDYDAAVPKFDVLDPVRAVYRRTRVLEVLDAESGVPSPSGLVDRLRGVFVAADRIRTVDPTLVSFLDVNTLEDLQSAFEKVQAPTKDEGGAVPDTSRSP